MPTTGAQFSTALEAVYVAQWAGYRFFGDWEALTIDQQAYLIAAYQVQNELAAADAQARAKEAERQAKRASKS